MRSSGLPSRELEQADAPVGAGDAEHAVAVFDVAPRRLRAPAPPGSCAFSTVRSDATRTAEPPTNSEREPALPKPVPRSVSPNDMRIVSIGTPNTSTASCVKRRRDALAHRLRGGERSRSCRRRATVTSTVSSNTSPPVHSRNVAMPCPRSRPRRFESAARAAKPFQSASASAWSITCSNWPLS